MLEQRGRPPVVTRPLGGCQRQYSTRYGCRARAARPVRVLNLQGNLKIEPARAWPPEAAFDREAGSKDEGKPRALLSLYDDDDDNDDDDDDGDDDRGGGGGGGGDGGGGDDDDGGDGDDGGDDDEDEDEDEDDNNDDGDEGGGDEDDDDECDDE